MIELFHNSQLRRIAVSGLNLFLIVYAIIACTPETELGPLKRSPISSDKNKPNNNPKSADATNLESAALNILEQQCASCHNLANGQGGFSAVLDVEEMIKSARYIIPGNAEESEIVKRLAPIGNMPPSGVFSSEDQKTLVNWINGIKLKEVQLFSNLDELDTTRKDLEAVGIADRPFMRYFSLKDINNTGSGDDIKDAVRSGLAKALNSLSFSSTLVSPKAVGDKNLIYRVDLRELSLSPEIFDGIMADFYPFTLDYVTVQNNNASEVLSGHHQFLTTQTGTPNYLVRADWFVSTATLPELYNRFLNLGQTLQELEAQLGVNTTTNIVNNQVMRSGFRNSGVSSQNRILERHASASTNLAYWISYDFADNNEGQQNIFNFPLGPIGSGFDEKAFDHDGGEVIFQLPNGLFGYFLTLANGTSIDKGPINIVRQNSGPKEFFQAIVNGISCMSCHGQGLLFKKDDIRDFVSVSQDFSAAEKAKVLELFPTSQSMQAMMDSDNKKYFDALQKIGVDPTQPDPVNIVFSNYNKNLYRVDVQAELGVSEQTLNTILNAEPFKSTWVSIYTNSGSITRSEFNLLYGQIAQEFLVGMNSVAPSLGDHLITPACMVADAAQMDSCTKNLNAEEAAAPEAVQ